MLVYNSGRETGVATSSVDVFCNCFILKVPSVSEIFDNSNFDDFYTIKSLWGGATFGLK
jgi:hypothetical protein